MAERKKLVVIDGKSVFYRGYYAMPNLSTRDGTPTGGVFGFATMALEVIKRLKPDYVAVAWDKSKTNIRRRVELYPQYKAGRKPAPADFYEQIPVLHELLKAFGWPLYEFDDYEADDIMGTLALQGADAGLDVLLVTSDLDMLQLVNEHVHVYALKQGLSNIELYNPETFEQKYGISVHQFLDLKSLKGDSSDNIPGVPGIGEKTAIQLLQEYKTLDGVYENVELTKKSTHDKLVAGKELAYLSKKLAAIWTDAPLKLDLTEVDGSKVQPEKLLDLLEKLEFKSLARQLPEIMHVAVMEHKATTGQPVDNLVLIDTDAKLDSLKLPQTIFVYSRTAGKHGRKPQVLIIGTEDSAYAMELSQLDLTKVVNKLSEVKALIGYDVKATLQVLLELGVNELPYVQHDVLVGAFIINSLRREQTLTDLARVDCGYDGSAFEDLDNEQLISRAAEVVWAIKTLYDQQVKEMSKEPKLASLAKDVEWPVVPVLARMEWRGILLDKDYLAKFEVEISNAISDLEQEIYGHAGKEFNIASPAQLSDVLFTTLGLSAQGIKKGKTSYSTAASELDKLRGLHPIVDLITQYREVTKLKNTYVDTLPKQADENSRVHTTFNLTIAQTGRLSSTDPNLQNIPVRTDLGKRVRTAFVADKGRKLVSADYSQFELRLAAAMSGDKEQVDMFNRGADIHTMTAAEIYGREPEDVTKQMRSAAKAVNFGIIYGLGPHSLAASTGMTFAAASKFIQQYTEIRKPMMAYLNGLKDRARQDGYVETLLGRRRPMPDIKSSNFAVRAAAERAAMNMPIQGTEADLMKLAMVAVDEELAKFKNAYQLLQIHDSVLVECDSGDVQAVADVLKRTMENIYPELSVKLLVDVSIGDNWGEL